MKHLYPSFSHTRRALCATTLVLVAGAMTALAQTNASSSSSSSPNSSNSSYNQPSNQNDSSRRNTQSSGATTSGSYGTSASGNYNANNRDTSASGSANRDATASGSYNRDTTATTSGTGSYGSNPSDKLSWGDKRFVTKAGDHGQSELAIAQLASQQASNPEVRRYAQRLVTDHTKANQELMSLASSKNVKLDQDSGQDRTYRRLSDRQGQDFDQEFIEQMIDMHEADVKMFEKASQDAKDQEVRSFASRHVGHLREHLQQAQNLRSTIMPTGRESDTSGGASKINSTSATGSTTGSSDRNSTHQSGSSASGATDSSRNNQSDRSSNTSAQPNR